MRIYLATDHAGFELKEKIKEYLKKDNVQVEDFGAFAIDKNDDYPDFISKAASAVSQNPHDRAIIFGGSGQGEAIVANKYKHVRAVVFYSLCMSLTAIDVQGTESDDPFEIIRLTREHNDANILSIGVRFLSEQEVKHAVDLFLKTPFLHDPRHVRRIAKISNLENRI